jgi:outer membrane immunogenic protein
MKRLVCVGIALGALVAPVMAADMKVKAPILKAPPPVYSWTGCYIGANAGWKWGRFHDESVDVPAATGTVPGGTVTAPADHINLDNINTGSGAAGGQVGCRQETSDHWVVGLEGDFDWTNLHGTVVNNGIGPGTTFVPGDNFGNHAQWESSLRLVLGHAWDRVFLYATGGVAFTRVTMEANFIASLGGCVGGIPCLFPPSAGSDSKTLVGGTIGAGGAYALDKNWSIGAEYRFTAYQKGDFGLGGVAAECGTSLVAVTAPVCFNQSVTGHKSLDTQEVLFKLNYQFSAGPLVAKY